MKQISFNVVISSISKEVMVLFNVVLIAIELLSPFSGTCVGGGFKGVTGVL